LVNPEQKTLLGYQKCDDVKQATTGFTDRRYKQFEGGCFCGSWHSELSYEIVNVKLGANTTSSLTS